jgi:hypothetical protein
VGEFKDNRRNGQGIWTVKSFKYEGGWKNDNYHGQGTETYLKGLKYVGEFRDGYRCGQGTMTFPDGRKYEGEWYRNLFHGRGTLTAPDGKQQSGGWDFGEYRGSNAVIPKVQAAETTGRPSAGSGPFPPAAGRDAGDAAVLVDENTVWRHLHLDGPSYFLLDDPAPTVDLGNAEIVKTALGPMAKVMMRNETTSSQPGRWPPELTSPAPPSDWADVTCDDSLWLRTCWPQPIPRFPKRAPESAAQHSPESNVAFDTVVVLARSRFEIKDAARVKACRLSLDYWGGVVVYVNGKEAARDHLPGQETNILERLAEPYSESIYPAGGSEGELNGCLRQLREVEIPAAMLRPGVNVLAVEVHAAPISGSTWRRFDGGCPWPAIGVKRARLTVAPADAAVTKGLRLQGLQVWNCAVNDTAIIGNDLREASAPVEPVQIRAARNSVFSGRLMAGSDQPIKGLTVTVSDLVQVHEGGGAAGPPDPPGVGMGKLPASAVRVRYAVPATPDKSWVSQGRFDGLLDQIPTDIPLGNIVVRAPAEHWMYWGDRALTQTAATMAVAPLWFTVRVPTNAAAGRYEGRITIAAQGFPSRTVPLHVQVYDWVMPDARDWCMQNFIYHAEEMEALHYGVTNYSARHFELVGKTLALLAELNSRQVMVNLVCNFFASGYGGANSNPESLVRWVKQPDGTFQHDFTQFDRYLDVVAKTVGKPRTLRLNCWGEYNPKRIGTSGWISADFDNTGERPVTVFDPATGQLSRMKQPPLGTEENYRFWKPVFDELLKKIKARGWLDETTLGYNAWFATSFPALIDVANRLWPGGEWSFTGHNGASGMLFRGSDTNTVMIVRHADTVYGGPGGSPEPPPRRNTLTFGCRLYQFDSSPLNELRLLPENYVLNQGYDGLGDFGANLYPLKRPVGGYYVPAAGAGTGWAGDGRSTLALLYPGPDGPVATERFEMLREGIELCEAVSFVRNTLTKDKKSAVLSPHLRQRAERYLRERTIIYPRLVFRVRYLSAVEDAKLLDLAGEVARELERKK